MGMRVAWFLFCGGEPDAIRSRASQMLRDAGWDVDWSTDAVTGQSWMQWHSNAQGSLYCPSSDAPSTWQVFQRLSAEFGIPFMHLRIQEGNHWDYSFHMGEGLLDSFSADPDYWEQDPQQVRGKPSVISRWWRIPEEGISKYLQFWGRKMIDEDGFVRVLTGKAYPEDQYGYGDIWQACDFADAILGERDSLQHGRRFLSRCEKVPQ